MQASIKELDVKMHTVLTTNSLKKCLDDWCTQQAAREAEMSDEDREACYEVIGHTAQILNALLAAIEPGSALDPDDEFSLVVEGEMLCRWLTDNMAEVVQ